MWDVIPDQLPWWIAGPGIGVCVVALYALANAKLGVSGSWLQLLFLLQRRPLTEPWRLWFIVGSSAGRSPRGTATCRQPSARRC